MWKNALGDEVDLDNIDKVYALNILSMVLLRCGRQYWSDDEIRADPLVGKLRSVVLTGRSPNASDRLRGRIYNIRCRVRGLPYRAGQ